MIIVKPQGAQVALTAANTVSNGSLIYIVNTGAAGVANVQYANGVVYANVTVTNTYPTLLQKSMTDLVIGTSTMFAVPVAYKGA
jgi:hypothetical protein